MNNFIRCGFLVFFTIFFQGCSQQEVYTSEATKQFSHSDAAAEGVALSHDGKYSIVATASNVCVWDNTRDKLHFPCLEGPAVEFTKLVGISQNNRFFFASNQVITRLYQMSDGSMVGEWHLSDNIINDIAISARGDKLLLGARSGYAAIIDARAQKITTFKKHQLDVNAVALSADGKLALTGSSDKMAYLWQTSTGETVHSFSHKSRVNHVTISDDGSIGLTLDAIESHIIWDLVTGDKKSSLDTHLRFFEFNHARFSADNKLLLAGLPKRKIQLWRVEDGVKLAEWFAMQQRVRAAVLAVSFGDNADQVLTENSDGLLEVWDMPPLTHGAP